MENNTGDIGFSYLHVASIVVLSSCALLLFVSAVLIYKDAEDWRAFSAAHNCELLPTSPGFVSSKLTLSPPRGNNSTYRCDNGVFTR